MADSVYTKAAELLGWRWSAAHGGYINESKLRSDKPRGQWDSYYVAMDSEDACFVSGVETLSDATKVLEEAKT